MRKKLLNDLLEMNSDLGVIDSELKKLTWDSNEELAILERGHMERILDRYLQGGLDSEMLEEWANIVEGRDDIGFEPGYESILQQVIFQLANPLLNAPVTPESVRKVFRKLKVDSER